MSYPHNQIGYFCWNPCLVPLPPHIALLTNSLHFFRFSACKLFTSLYQNTLDKLLARQSHAPWRKSKTVCRDSAFQSHALRRKNHKSPTNTIWKRVFASHSEYSMSKREYTCCNSCLLPCHFITSTDAYKISFIKLHLGPEVWRRKVRGPPQDRIETQLTSLRFVLQRMKTLYLHLRDLTHSNNTRWIAIEYITALPSQSFIAQKRLGSKNWKRRKKTKSLGGEHTSGRAPVNNTLNKTRPRKKPTTLCATRKAVQKKQQKFHTPKDGWGHKPDELKV